MRLWSIHPKYLDSKGLVALWRESLLAKKVLSGKTKGYKNHPQLERFKAQKGPVKAVNAYLATIWDESCRRHYCFDKCKIGTKSRTKIKVNSGQVEYEFKHLKAKLKKRDPKKHKELSKVKKISVNPTFSVKKGPVESWEKQ
jgi:hypothetical protein